MSKIKCECEDSQAALFCVGTGEVPPSVDDRCADPVFYKNNPDICRGYPILLIKPEFSITAEGGTIQFKTYLRAAGDEMEITNGLTYSSSDVGVLVIESESGLATGVESGLVSVSVVWQNLSAHAQVEVVATCAAIGNNLFIVIDNSYSSKVSFSSAYATRLSFAKEAAVKFADSVNYSKDKVGVAYFNEGGVVVLTLSDDKAAVIAAIQSITATNSKTSLAGGLQLAMDNLNAVAGGKIVVLFSDGENNTGADPLLLSDPWKDAGKLIMVVALRAWGEYFDMLYHIASTGYFLSAYGDTQAEVISTLKGLKSYFCSGDCQPEAGTYPVAQLNYRGFANWDVFQGQVDLIGLGNWDVQPGNGLYVDLSGTRNPGLGIFDVLPGGLVSKAAVSIVSGRDYRFSIYVAGNNVNIDNTDPVRVQIYSEDGLTTFLDETITPTSNVMPFTLYTFDFTAAMTATALIKIEMIQTVDSIENVGPLIDAITFEDLTTPLVLLEDDFDNENETIIEPSYSYYGCLDTPPGAQSADPTPPVPPAED